MRTILAFTICVCLHAQTSAPPAPSLPAWAGAGALYAPQGSPKVTGWAALAMPVSNAAQLYSFSLYQAIPVRGKVPTISTTTGMDALIRTIKTPHGTLTIHGIGTAGVATTSNAVTGAFAGGGGAMFRWTNGFTAECFVLQNSAGGVAKPTVLIGTGRTW